MYGAELSSVLIKLREQLGLARAEGANKGTRFRLEDIEVELNVAVTDEGAAKGGVKFWVIDAGVDVKTSQVVTQKIKLKMKLEGEDGALIAAGERREQTAGSGDTSEKRD
jgi:hypothetical protein